MKLPEVFTQYIRPEPYYENIIDEGLVESEGYVSTDNLIKAFIEAGTRINIARGYIYNNLDNVDSNDDGWKENNLLDTLQERNERIKIMNVMKDVKVKKEVGNVDGIKEDEKEKEVKDGDT